MCVSICREKQKNQSTVFTLYHVWHNVWTQELSARVHKVYCRKNPNHRQSSLAGKHTVTNQAVIHKHRADKTRGPVADIGQKHTGRWLLTGNMRKDAGTKGTRRSGREHEKRGGVCTRGRRRHFKHRWQTLERGQVITHVGNVDKDWGVTATDKNKWTQPIKIKQEVQSA